MEAVIEAGIEAGAQQPRFGRKSRAPPWPKWNCMTTTVSMLCRGESGRRAGMDD